MKRILIAVLLVGGGWLIANRNASVRAPEPTSAMSAQRPEQTPSVDESENALARAFEKQHSNVQVRAQGIVLKALPDDNQGSRHQRFLVRLSSGQTLLIAHNIDLAPRIESLREGDNVAFYGEYEWNNKGGVIHWTHRDPRGHHPDGWLEHNGKRYE